MIDKKFNSINPNLSDIFTSRFWSKVDIQSIDKCWEWKRYTTRDGYGRVRLGGFMVLSHRVAFAIGNALDPDGYLVCHTCDNPPCCNPDHLFLGDDMENSKDKIKKGRDRHAAGEMVGGSVFTNSEVMEIRSSHVPYKNSAAKIARERGVHKSCIEKILQRVTWKSI